MRLRNWDLMKSRSRILGSPLYIDPLRVRSGLCHNEHVDCGVMQRVLARLALSRVRCRQRPGRFVDGECGARVHPPARSAPPRAECRLWVQQGDDRRNAPQRTSRADCRPSRPHPGTGRFHALVPISARYRMGRVDPKPPQSRRRVGQPTLTRVSSGPLRGTRTFPTACRLALPFPGSRL